MTAPPETLPLSLVVFAYNEVENVPPVLGAIVAWLRGRGAPYELLFVDDGSTDRTGTAADSVLAGDPHARVLRHKLNRGIGAALKTGVRAATLPWVTFLPCDGQIAPAELDVLCEAAVRTGVSTVFSVYRARDDGWQRTLMSAGIRTMIRTLFGVTMHSDGPYLFQRALFDPDLLVPDSFFLNFEFPIRVMRAGTPSTVETIECRPRLSGHSKSTGFARVAGVTRDLLGLRLRLSLQPFVSR